MTNEAYREKPILSRRSANSVPRIFAMSLLTL